MKIRTLLRFATAIASIVAAACGGHITDVSASSGGPTLPSARQTVVEWSNGVPVYTSVDAPTWVTTAINMDLEHDQKAKIAGKFAMLAALDFSGSLNLVENGSPQSFPLTAHNSRINGLGFDAIDQTVNLSPILSCRSKPTTGVALGTFSANYGIKIPAGPLGGVDIEFQNVTQPQRSNDAECTPTEVTVTLSKSNIKVGETARRTPRISLERSRPPEISRALPFPPRPTPSGSRLPGINRKALASAATTSRVPQHFCETWADQHQEGRRSSAPVAR